MVELWIRPLLGVDDLWLALDLLLGVNGATRPFSASGSATRVRVSLRGWRQRSAIFLRIREQTRLGPNREGAEKR